MFFILKINTSETLTNFNKKNCDSEFLSPTFAVESLILNVNIMEDLKELLSKLDAESSEKEIATTFEKIANILLFRSHIKTPNGNYRILEIEFYFKNNKHKDNVTIERTEEAGMWWLHDYGVDLTFKSDENKKFYGGILIRSIISLDKNDEDKEIYGPRKCCWHLFYFSALEQNMVPQIVMNDSECIYNGTLETTKRYITRKPKPEDGIYRDSLYRFYVNGLDLHVEKNYKKASPWK